MDTRTREVQPERHTTETHTGDVNQHTHCTECNSTNIVKSQDQGELVCEDCGLVIDEQNIDYGPEWRDFATDKKNKSRVGSPVTKTIHDKGLTTTIDWKDKDVYGRTISADHRNTMHRLRKWQKRIRTKDASERNLQFALSEIDRMASALGAPKQVREIASVTYRRALREDLIRGRSIEGVAAASLYVAFRQTGIPRSLEELSEVARIERKEIGRTYRYISRELGLGMEPVDPKMYVPRFCSGLELSERVRTKALEVIDTTAEQGLLSGKSPTGFAASAIYAAALLCGEKRTQREVSEVSQVTEVTIRNRYQEQIKAMGIHTTES